MDDLKSLPVTAVILAAGMGKRMKSTLPKVLQPMLGQPMINYVLSSLRDAGIQRPIVVVGHGANEVMKTVGDRGQFSLQREQLGTGHAVQCALPRLEGFSGDVIVTCGDTPLISPECYRLLVEERRRLKAAAVMATMILDDPKAYGRVKRTPNGNVKEVVEFKDASEGDRRIKEVNTGTYCFDAEALRESLEQIDNNNAQGEFYLPDTIAVLIKKKRQVNALVTSDPGQFLGVNDCADMVAAERWMGNIVKQKHLANGVILEEPHSIRIEPGVEIGARTRLRPGTILEGSTVIGTDCVVGPGVVIRNGFLSDGTVFEPHRLIGPEPGNGL